MPLAGIGCLIAGGVYYSKYDPGARAREIDTYTTALSAWAAPFGFSGGSNNFKSIGFFNITADMPIGLPLVTAAIEPYSIESASDVPAYTDRAAYSTRSSPFMNTLYVGGESRATLNVYGPTGFLFSRSLLMEKEYTTSATQNCRTSSSGTRTCSYSCSKGRLSGSTCYWNLYPNQQGICIAVDPVTKMYSGPCAINDDAAASTLDSDPVPNKMSDVSLSYGENAVSPWWQNGWPITIRSANDPWVIVAQTTRGYMQFGGVSDRYRSYGTTLMGVGAGLFAPGLIAISVLICCACKDTCSSAGATLSNCLDFSSHASNASRRIQSVRTGVNNRSQASLRSISKSFSKTGGPKGPLAPSPTGYDPSGGNPTNSTGIEMQQPYTPRGPAPVVTFSGVSPSAPGADYAGSAYAPVPTGGYPAPAPVGGYPAQMGVYPSAPQGGYGGKQADESEDPTSDNPQPMPASNNGTINIVVPAGTGTIVLAPGPAPAPDSAAVQHRSMAL